MTITAVKLDQFTAFRKLELEASQGVNILIGANGTGKTYLLKVIYTACDITRTKASLPEKLLRVFLPYQRNLGRLVYRQPGTARGAIEVYRDALRIRVSFSNHWRTARSATVTGAKEWEATAVECAYLPVKEMLAHAPGFRSLYTAREIHFEEIYADIVDRAYRPLLRGRPPPTRACTCHASTIATTHSKSYGRQGSHTRGSHMLGRTRSKSQPSPHRYGR